MIKQLHYDYFNETQLVTRRGKIHYSDFSSPDYEWRKEWNISGPPIMGKKRAYDNVRLNCSLAEALPSPFFQYPQRVVVYHYRRGWITQPQQWPFQKWSSMTLHRDYERHL